MKKRRGGSRMLALVLVLLCAAIVIAVAWGVVSVLNKLSQYGSNATIGSQEDPSAEVPGVSMESDNSDGEAEPLDSLPWNTYDTAGFYTENGLKRYDAADMEGVAGIDVSSYQQEIDWEAVRDAGVEFAMIRVGYRGYSSGELDLDDYFLRNMRGALDAGLQVGVYFFSQALTEEEAVEEAEYVLNWIEGYDIQYPVVFDWEELELQARTDEMNMLMLTSCALAFCQTIEEAGYDAGVYFNQVYGYQQLNLPSLQAYDFWLAQYEDTPSFVYDFQIWQYTNEGTVPGIEGPVDLNIAFRPKG